MPDDRPTTVKIIELRKNAVHQICTALHGFFDEQNQERRDKLEQYMNESIQVLLHAHEKLVLEPYEKARIAKKDAKMRRILGPVDDLPEVP